MRFEQLQAFDSYFDEDGTPLDFCVDRMTIHVEEVRVVLDRLPYLRNPMTGSVRFTTAAVHIIDSYVAEARGKQSAQAVINQFGRFERGGLPLGKGAQFRYSAAEHFFIPGLVTSMPSERYLTPVYFSRNVLMKYRHVEGYGLQSFTDSCGSISIDGGGTLPYGVNKEGYVMMWFGDVVKLDERERFYLYSENVGPQYDLHSDFYDNQIQNKWI